MYTFIIPHKNCPKLLNRCLDSIPKREDVQIIVVDDNSDSDKKPQIDREDVELVLLDAEQSKGAGRARNIGIKMAKGKWLLFADADDRYTDYLPKLLDKYADDTATDVVFLNAFRFNDKGMVFPLEIDRLIKNYLKGKKDSEKGLRYGRWTPWVRMVKRDLVSWNQIFFEEVPFGNDIMFSLNTSLHAKTIAAEQEMVYQHYRWPHGSVTETYRNKLIEHSFVNRGKVISFHQKVGYHSNVNFWGITFSLIRRRKTTVRQAFRFYRKYLNAYHICWATDIWRWVCDAFERRVINYGTNRLLKKAYR